jgi:hypothetical protein
MDASILTNLETSKRTDSFQDRLFFRFQPRITGRTIQEVRKAVLSLRETGRKRARTKLFVNHVCKSEQS